MSKNCRHLYRWDGRSAEQELYNDVSISRTEIYFLSHPGMQCTHTLEIMSTLNLRAEVF